jgi:hypothetical protein
MKKIISVNIFDRVKTLKVYRKAGIWLHSFITSTLEGSVYLPSTIAWP